MRLVKNGALASTPFLDLSARTNSGGETGLLGVAFHPDFAHSGFVFVAYTSGVRGTLVSRFHVATDADVVELASEQVLLVQPQIPGIHNGGNLAFGPDGMLYIGFGDGGPDADPTCRAQDPTNWNGKLLRVDVDHGTPYAIPADNPFADPNDGVRDEIWALGLRNPWRFSFDRATGELYLGDVGELTREELDILPAGAGGQNFGWSRMEGDTCCAASRCSAALAPCGDPGFAAPAFTYPSGCVIGGFVYRGCAIPGLQGSYFFANYANLDRIWSFRHDPLSGAISEFVERTTELAPGGGLSIHRIVALGEDGFGELLIVDHSARGHGEVFKIVAAGSAQAAAAVRNGGGTNRACFTSASLPILGSSWVARVDSAGRRGVMLALLIGRAAPASGLFVGASELLVDLGALRLVSVQQAFGAGAAEFRLPVPCDLALNGRTVYTQAALLGGGVELCNALDLTFGTY